ncbi:MAG TPA: CBS domain-containing protein [Nitrospiria bacterium]|nr:CBS domain-containing protein [Nitrospiria bacterium]
MNIQTRYQTISEIKSTNSMRIDDDMNAVDAVDTLLKTHKSGAPVVDQRGACIGFINETILLDAVLEGKNLKGLTARDVMAPPHTVKEDMPIESAIRFMDQHHLQQLPVVKDGKLMTTITRHDLLRAVLDLGLGVEQ